MDLILQIYQDNLLPDIVNIWNSAMKDQHGFFPLTPNILRQHYASSKRFRPEFLLVANNGIANVGFIHIDIVDEPPYEKAGVISAMAVIPEYQLEGIGSKLLSEAITILERNRIKMIDACGAWPYSSFYATLIDGSERAGINLKNKGGKWLFNKFGFKDERESLTMQYRLENSKIQENHKYLIYNQSRQGKKTWLDDSFRSWVLYDHAILSPSGKVMSRAIYGRMDGESNFCKQEKYSLFSVSTPSAQQGKGMATANLKLICSKLKSEGVDELELHVYTDNTPAVGLYQKIGFTEAGRTMLMRRYKD